MLSIDRRKYGWIEAMKDIQNDAVKVTRVKYLFGLENPEWVDEGLNPDWVEGYSAAVSHFCGDDGIADWYYEAGLVGSYFEFWGQEKFEHPSIAA